MPKNWMTTLAGIITAVGVALLQNEDATLKLIGQVLSVVGPLILGWAAKDFNKTGV